MRTPAITPMSRLAAAALALANLVMLFVAAFQKWGYEILLSTIWWETVIIGFYNAGLKLFIDMATHRLEHRSRGAKD